MHLMQMSNDEELCMSIRFKLGSAAALMFLAGCQVQGPAPSASVSASLITKPLINGCSAANTSACEYQPVMFSASNGVKLQETITYVDYAGQQPCDLTQVPLPLCASYQGLERSIDVELRFPQGLVTPTPIVIWSHGGSSGKNNPAVVGTEWGEVFQRGGYLSIHIAHTKRTRNKTVALCDAIGVVGCETTCTVDSDCTDYPDGSCDADFGECRYFKSPNWDRPDDLAALLDWLEVENAPGGAYAGMFDLDNIVYAGHSAGGGAAMMAAGATRFYADSAVDRVKLEPRIKAFISLSPQPPGEDGFTTGSFDGSVCDALTGGSALCFGRPHLVVTGSGDDTSGTVAEDRRIPFDLMPGGVPSTPKFLAWMDDEAARHGTFEHNPDKCEDYAKDEGLDPAIYQDRCADQLVWLDSVVLAFLDGNLRGSSAARQWMRSGNVEMLSGEVMTLEER